MIQMIGFWISLLLMHPLHLGVIHLNVNDENVASIEVRLFTDDLETAITHRREQVFKLEFGNEESIKHVSDYIENELYIYTDNKSLELNFIEMKKERDVTVVKYETKIESKKSLKVCCEVFFELFRDQTNLVILKTNNIEEGYRLDQSKSCIIVEN